MDKLLKDLEKYFKGVRLRFKRNFITGIVVLLPLSLTVLAIRIFLKNASPLGKYLITNLLDIFNLPHARFLPIIYPIMGIAFLASLTWFIGLVASNYLGRKIVRFGENILSRIWFINSIYFAAKQMLEAFTVRDKNAFRQAVVVEYPRKGLYSVGFLTSTSPTIIKNIHNEELVNIFVPTTPNPTSGIFIMANKNELFFLNISVEDAIKFIVSAGMITPKNLVNDALKDSSREES